MDNQHKRCEGHDFKENQCCKQIGRKENPHRRAKCQKHKEIITVPVPLICHIFFGKQCCQKPDCTCQHSQYNAESISRKADAQSAETRQGINGFLANQCQTSRKGQRGKYPRPYIPCFFIAAANAVANHRAEHREES